MIALWSVALAVRLPVPVRENGEAGCLVIIPRIPCDGCLKKKRHNIYIYIYIYICI